MAIITWPDPRLEQVCAPVEQGERCRELVDEMFASLGPTGIGLAAPQIGVMKRVIVVRVPINNGNTHGVVKHAVINPVISWIKPNSRMVEDWESCLSFPDHRVSVPRYQRIQVSGYDIRWNYMVIGAKDLVARVFAHEIDHLNGRTLAHYARIAHEVEQERLAAEAAKQNDNATSTNAAS